MVGEMGLACLDYNNTYIFNMGTNFMGTCYQTIRRDDLIG